MVLDMIVLEGLLLRTTLWFIDETLPQVSSHGFPNFPNHFRNTTETGFRHTIPFFQFNCIFKSTISECSHILRCYKLGFQPESWEVMSFEKSQFALQQELQIGPPGQEKS